MTEPSPTISDEREVDWWSLFMALWFFGAAAYRYGQFPTIDVLLLIVGGWRLGNFFDSLERT